MRINEMIGGSVRGKRTRMLKDSDAGFLKGFRLISITLKGEKAVRTMRKSISKKDVKGYVVSANPLVIEFFYGKGFSKQVGVKSTEQIIGLLMKGQGADINKDYTMELMFNE